MPKFGTKSQFEYPKECPEECSLKPDIFYQGSICTRCPVFCCKEGTTEEDKKYLPVLSAIHFRDDWAEEWETFFKTGKYPELIL